MKAAHVEIFCDEEGNDIVYEHNGKEYVAAQIVYDLGKVIEKSDYWPTNFYAESVEA